MHPGQQQPVSELVFGDLAPLGDGLWFVGHAKSIAYAKSFGNLTALDWPCQRSYERMSHWPWQSKLAVPNFLLMTHRTDRYRLIEGCLGESLATFVADRRRVDCPPFGQPRSWRSIAEELRERTGIEVHHESLRLWFADARDRAAA